MVEAIRAWVERELERFGVPGLGLGVLHDGQVVLAEGFGVRDLGTGQPLTARTQLAIGSSSKAFTAALLGALVDDGLLEWDRPVRDYLPWFRMHDPVATERLTPRDMLCHRSGLPRHDFVWYGDPPMSRQDLVRRLPHLEPNKDFRELWQYNNLLFITAGFLAGELLGGTWEDAVRKRLLEPLGMSSTNFSVEDMRRSPDHSSPHDERDGELRTIPFRKIDLTGPAGSINSTIEEMLAFLETNLEGGRYGETQVMSPATVREMQSPQMVAPARSLFDEVGDHAYGLGWFIGDYRGRRYVHHGGNIDGFTALVAMLPASRLGVVILSNRGATPLREALAYQVFDTLLGLEPIPWGDRFASLLEASKSGQEASRAREVASFAPDAPPSHRLDAYTGGYEHPGYGTFSITLSEDGGHLVPRYNGLELTLGHRHYDVFELGLKAGQVFRALVFETDADGDIASFSVDLEPSVGPLRFRRLPDEQLRDPQLLRRLAGTYERGPIRLRVDRKGDDRLSLVLPGGTPRDLDPKRGTTFTLADMPGIRVTFELEDDVVARVWVDTMGAFTPAAED